MSTAVSVFKLNVQSVCQLQQQKIEDFEVSFEMTGLPYQWTPVANYSTSITRQSSARQYWSVLACVALSSQYRTHVIIQWIEIWRLKYQRGYFLKSESQFNCLFTLKSIHLNSNSYNFWTLPNIATKFARYLAWILLCKQNKFGEKIYYNSRDIEFFLGVYFFGAPCMFAV